MGEQVDEQKWNTDDFGIVFCDMTKVSQNQSKYCVGKIFILLRFRFRFEIGICIENIEFVVGTKNWSVRC